MGNNLPQAKLQQISEDNDLSFFLKKFKIYTNQNNLQIKSVSHASKLTLFEMKEEYENKSDKNKRMLAVNSQAINKQKSSNSIQSLKNHITYYQSRRSIIQTLKNQGIQCNIIPLIHFQIRNFDTQQKIYPLSKSSIKKLEQKDPKNRNFSCGFQNIFAKRQPNSSSLVYPKKQAFFFNFLQQFTINCLQKEIQFRAQKDQYFSEKQIWSIIYCCSSTSHQMVKNGLKEPMLSPASIFINCEGEIRVGEWQFVNYCQNLEFDQNNQSLLQQGQTFVSTQFQSTFSYSKGSKHFDILTRYYWPPEGVVEIQNSLRLGQLFNDQSLSEAKNSQVFSLGMTVLQMLSLKKHYQKSTYSEKQLKKLIEESIKVRKNLREQISQQLIQLLLKMLEWDPKERCRYSQIVDLVNGLCESDFPMFNQSQLRQASIKNSRIKNNQADYQDKKQIDSLVTEFSVNQNFQSKYYYENRNTFTMSMQQNHSTFQEIKRACEKFDLKEDQMEGSGVICQGLGDDYQPQIQNQYQNQCRVLNHETLSNLVPNERDAEDIPNETLCFLRQISQVQNPDTDSDFDGQNQNASQSSNQCSSVKKLSFQQINRFDVSDDFFKNNTKIGYIKQQNSWKQNTQKQQDNQLYETSFNRNMNKNGVFSFIDMNTSLNEQKNRFQFECNQVKSKESLLNSSKVKIFSGAIKYINSPISTKQNQNKENYFQKRQQNNEGLFTSPDLMAMIRQFTQNLKPQTLQKQQSNQYNWQKQKSKSYYQQTPNFQSINLLDKKNQSHQQNRKQLFFEEKSFQNCFIESNCYNCSNNCDIISEDNCNDIYTYSYEQIQKFTKEKDDEFLNFDSQQLKHGQTLVKQEFSKGCYEGTKKNGVRNGFGTFYYKEGGKYSGFWYNNKMDGHGTLYYPDGRVAYEGQWQNDSLHGKGILHNQKPTLIQGQYEFSSFDECENQQCWIYYDGWFENDEKSGFGELMLSNGQKYVGQFKNDMVYGKGKFYRNDGSIYEGQWQNNQIIMIN